MLSQGKFDTISEERAKALEQQIKMVAAQYALFGGNSSDKSNRNTALSGDYTIESLADYFKDPDGNASAITDMSRFFAVANSLYGGTIRKHKDLMRLDYVVYPDFFIDVDNITDNEIDDIIKGEFYSNQWLSKVANKPTIRDIMRAVITDSSYYGYYIDKDKKNPFIQPLPRGFCREGVRVNGLLSVEFNFSFFDNNEDSLDLFPAEFKTLYRKYAKNSDLQWAQLNPDNAFCIIYEENDHNYPPFISMIGDIMDEDEIFNLIKRQMRADAVRLIAQIGEVDEQTGMPLIDPDLMFTFANMIKAVVGDDVSVASTLFDLKPIEFKSNTDNSNKNPALQHAQDKIISGSSLSNAMLGGDLSNETALMINYYNMIDFNMSILEKIELWINKKLSQVAKPKKYPFKIMYLPKTNYTKPDDLSSEMSLLSIGGSLQTSVANSGQSEHIYTSLLRLEKIKNAKEMLVVPTSMHTTSTTVEEIEVKKEGDDE